jgi:hypothetical protein
MATSSVAVLFKKFVSPPMPFGRVVRISKEVVPPMSEGSTPNVPVETAPGAMTNPESELKVRLVPLELPKVQLLDVRGMVVSVLVPFWRVKVMVKLIGPTIVGAVPTLSIS